MAQRELKVRVVLDVSLANPEDWTTAFGITGRNAIRDDVKEYVFGLVNGAGVFGNGEVDATVRKAN